MRSGPTSSRRSPGPDAVGLLDRLRKPPPAPAEADRLTLRQLESLGANLTRPRHVLHFLYFADGQHARDAAQDIDRAGYEVTISPPDDTIAEWSVRAEATRVVDGTTVDAFRAWFERVAAEHAGEYDGWEAAAQP